jgi:serine/threonine-protein kinase HipA
VKGDRKAVEVWADWRQLPARRRVGELVVQVARRGEVYSFSYDDDWLKSGPKLLLDPALQHFRGPQFPEPQRGSFGIFLDSSPDRWGRVLMDRREALLARNEQRARRPLKEIDYLLGVHDTQRLGGLRFRLGDGPFLDDHVERTAPPITSLRALEQASLELERNGDELSPRFEEALRLLLVPGSSLGGARPKASVTDVDGTLWLAKFPSASDTHDVGAWEALVAELARGGGVDMAPARAVRLGQRHHTFLTKRFDRDGALRLHFSSAMTMTGHSDGEGGSYLELADFLVRHGAAPSVDLEQLWRRIVFSMCISHVDDHLRNHGFLLHDEGWRLAPAYDVNPIPFGDGHVLNIDMTSNAQDLDLAREVAPTFRVSGKRCEDIVAEVMTSVRRWRAEADRLGIPRAEQNQLANAFRLAG